MYKFISPYARFAMWLLNLVLYIIVYFEPGSLQNLLEQVSY